MITGFSKEIFDNIMECLDKKEKLLSEYYNITKNSTPEDLIDNLENIIKTRSGIIEECTEIDKANTAVVKKLYGNEAH